MEYHLNKAEGLESIEVATEISDAIEYVPTSHSAIDSAIIKALSEIDATLDGFVGKKEFWTQESMKNDSTWNHLRLFARKELGKLGLSQTQPDLFWVSYSQQGASRRLCKWNNLPNIWS